MSEKLITPFGEKVIKSIESFGNFVVMSLQVFTQLLKGRIHFRNTIQQFAFIGADSLPIVILTSLAVGSVFCLQVSNQFIKFGAVSFIGGTTAMAIVRELGPMITAVVVAGRVGAAITAEIGSMKVTEQIDALSAMAISPLYYLVIPRMLACLIMLPMLSIISVGLGILGGGLICVGVKGIVAVVYVDSVRSWLVLIDIFKAMLKACIFGLIISLVACYQGLNTGKGAQGVGLATTTSVVVSLISIFISNYFLSAIMFP